MLPYNLNLSETFFKYLGHDQNSKGVGNIVGPDEMQSHLDLPYQQKKLIQIFLLEI